MIDHFKIQDQLDVETTYRMYYLPFVDGAMPHVNCEPKGTSILFDPPAIDSLSIKSFASNPVSFCVPVRMAMIDIYTVDAFTQEIFKGNPAAVCTSFRDVSASAELDILFQSIATEMNLSDTAFITRAKQSPSSTRYFLQWFTPNNEVNLCGHATLATAHVLFDFFLKDTPINELVFETKAAGELKVKCLGQGQLQLDFPAADPQPITMAEEILNQLRNKLNIPRSVEILAVQLCQRTKNLLLHLSELSDEIKPENSLMDIPFESEISSSIRSIIVTSRSDQADFISRFFAPWYGVLEDPVTGSAHTVLAVYWSRLLNHQTSVLRAYQKSTRGGHLECELSGDQRRVFIRGYAKTVLRGQMALPSAYENFVASLRLNETHYQ